MSPPGGVLDRPHRPAHPRPEAVQVPFGTGRDLLPERLEGRGGVSVVDLQPVGDPPDGRPVRLEGDPEGDRVGADTLLVRLAWDVGLGHARRHEGGRQHDQPDHDGSTDAQWRRWIGGRL